VARRPRAQLYPACDPYGFEALLTEGERSVLGRLREVLDRDVVPVVDDYWDRGEFPEQIRQPLADLRLMDAPELGPEPSPLYEGFRSFELARTDASTAVFYGAQAVLFRGAVRHGGSPEQVERLDADIRSWRTRGVLAITEPEHGSDVARGLATVAVRQGADWVLHGAKRWIGGAADAHYLTVIARGAEDGAARAFLVPADAPGVRIEKIERKTSLRIVNNGHITLEGVRVPEADRLQRVSSFRDVARLLRSMRADASFLAAGVQAGAYEAALRYTTTRRQFGRPVAGFQLVQDKLATMLGNLTASLGMAVRLAQLQGQGVMRDEDAALSKAWVARRMRETVALAREVCGGNGITLDSGAARFFADAEAVYTFEGTNEINQLVVGRAITGIGAFV